MSEHRKPRRRPPWWLILILAALAALTVAAFTVGGHPAHAAPVGDTTGAFSGPAGDEDASAFWVDAHAGLPDSWTPAKAGEAAELMCSKLNNGYSEGHLIAEIANTDGTPVSDGALRVITYTVHAAEWHYCPDRY